jgi:membrane protein
VSARPPLLSRLDPWLVRLEGYGPTLFLVRCYRIFMRIEGRDRVLMLAGQGFIALVPLLVVIASFTSASGASQVGEGIIAKMGLTDSAAEAVKILFAYPPGATGGITLFSVGLLLFSLNGFARSVQRTFEGAWGLSRVGMRGTASRTGGLIMLLGAGIAAGWLGGQLDTLPAGVVLALAAQALIIVGGWLLGTSLMLSGRTAARALLRGAVLSAVLQLIVGWGTAIYVPELFARNAERYGVVGVALALVTWLIAIASVIVGGAIVGAVLGGAGSLGSTVAAREQGPTLPARSS